MATNLETRRTYRPPAPPRAGKNPPHLSLRDIRRAMGLTLEQVSARITEHTPEMEVSRGTLSAIESGSRGVSDLMLRALEKALGFPDGSITTDYAPRGRGDAESP